MFKGEAQIIFLRFTTVGIVDDEPALEPNAGGGLSDEQNLGRVFLEK